MYPETLHTYNENIVQQSIYYLSIIDPYDQVLQ